MDWIERLFHISPDGGSGYLEYVIASFGFFLLAAPVMRRIRMRPRGPRGRAAKPGRRGRPAHLSRQQPGRLTTAATSSERASIRAWRFPASRARARR